MNKIEKETMAKFNEVENQEIKDIRKQCSKAISVLANKKNVYTEKKNLKNIEKSIYNETLKALKKIKTFDNDNEEEEEEIPLIIKCKRKYRQTYQKVVSNLFINECSDNVLKRIEDGEIKLTDVAGMKHDDLYPEKVERAKKKYDRVTFVGNNDLILQQKLIEEAKQEGKEYKGQFKCRKCKSDKNTTFRTAQTRCADEPATVFVTCLSCDIRWKR